MGEFFLDLRHALSPVALERVWRKALDDDCLGLAGQLAYFVLLSLFPFLMSLVALAGLMVDDPQSILMTFTRRMGGILPEDAVGLIADYVDRTLRSAASGVLFFGILFTLWSSRAASDAIVKAANRAYGLPETRPSWKLWGISALMVVGFALLTTTLALVVFGPEVGGYVQRSTGLPEVFLALWEVLRWALAFFAMTLAHDILYYVAPNTELPFKWITPGGFVATVLIIVSGMTLDRYASGYGSYDQIYGQLGAIIVLMLWLYASGLMVLLGLEMNAALARTAKEPKISLLTGGPEKQGRPDPS